MADLRLSDVAKSYGDVTILRDINLEIRQGELVVFVGPSGCGKSTLLRMIAGLEPITSGRLEIAGVLMNEVPPAQRGIAMVFQSYALYPHMTVRENMRFALKIAKMPKAESNAAVERAADILQLTPYLDRLPKELSGGQRQRVAIGRAIVRDPKVYLFDEPLSNLDAALRVATRIEIAQLKEAMAESTMIYVTHDQVEAMTLASRIVVLADGGIAQVGTPLELYERPANTFVAQFIGSPAMNILKGKVRSAGPETRVALECGDGEILVPIPTQEGLQGADVELGVRPEDLYMVGPSEPALVTAALNISEKLGEVTVIYGDLPGNDIEAQLVAKLPGIHHLDRGGVLRLGAAAQKLHLFHKGQSLRHVM